MKLSSRFLLDNLFVIAGAFLVAISMAWSANVTGWTAFGVSTSVTVIAAAAATFAQRTPVKLSQGAIALVGLWSLVAALSFSGTALTWLVFADALAVGVAALADLAAHEATTEKVVHQLEVRHTAGDRMAA